jgi:plastocyanin domain-containing protein
VTNAHMRLLFVVAAMLISCKQQPEAPAPSAPKAAPVAAQPPAAAPQAARPAPAVKEIAVTSKGFEPSRVEVPAGKPVILRFTRKVDETCADAVDIQGDDVTHDLPLDKPVDVKVTAPPSGQLAFACPMRMYRGTIVAVPQ